jgi:hypothetical protein
MECERPSGRELTGNDDKFDWIELIAQSPCGAIVARTFIRSDDHEAMEAWPKRFNNAAVSHSICVYAEPNRQARYVAPFYLHARSEDNLEEPKRCLLKANEQILIAMQAPEDCIHWYFDGNNGYELLIPWQTFDAFYSPWIFDLYADIATQQDRLQPGFLDLSIYSPDYAWTFPNSRRPGGLYKIALTEAEIAELSADEILAMAASPRPEDSYLKACIGKYASWWYTGELKRIEQERTRCPKCSESPAQPTHGWAMLPCVQVIESAVLADGTRHATYYSLASAYAGLNMHYPEIIARLRAIDDRNPVLDPNDIEKAAAYGCQHPSYAPCGTALQQYCPDGGCTLLESQQRPTG